MDAQRVIAVQLSGGLPPKSCPPICERTGAPDAPATSLHRSQPRPRCATGPGGPAPDAASASVVPVSRCDPHWHTRDDSSERRPPHGRGGCPRDCRLIAGTARGAWKLRRQCSRCTSTSRCSPPNQTYAQRVSGFFSIASVWPQPILSSVSDNTDVVYAQRRVLDHQGQIVRSAPLQSCS